MIRPDRRGAGHDGRAIGLDRGDSSSAGSADGETRLDLLTCRPTIVVKWPLMQPCSNQACPQASAASGSN